MKILILLLLSFPTFAEQLCVLDESNPEISIFMCKDLKIGVTHYQEVLPIVAQEAVIGLEEMGVKMISMEEFVTRVTPNDLLELKAGQLEESDVKPCFHRVYYKVREFNKLPDNHKTIKRLKTLAKAMQEAGVCELDVKKQSFNGINIQTKDDMLHHFLCISNSESVFGSRNIGMGGRGPWGIHPMHNQPKGTRAFVDGRTTTLPRNGVCYPSKAVHRDSKGAEIKDNSAYFKYDVILDNAKCALTLYRQNGFTAWGKNQKWGSNRHCSKTTRDRLQFFKHIGIEGCCSKECRDRYITDL